MKKFKSEKILYVIIALLVIGLIAVGAATVYMGERLDDFESLNVSLPQSDSTASEDLAGSDSSIPATSDINIMLDYDSSNKCFVSKAPDFVLNGAEGEQVLVKLSNADGYEITSYSRTEGYLNASLEAPVDAENPESDTYHFTLQVKTEEAENVVADAVYEFTDDSDSRSILGQKLLGNTGVTFIAADYEPEMSDAVLNAVKDIHANAQLTQGMVSVSFAELSFNAENGWGKDISILDNTLSIGNGVDSPICMTDYTRSLEGAGMTEEYSVNDGVVLLYGEYEDAQSGYQPYIYQTDSYTMKIMALGQEQLSTAFQSTAEEPVEQTQ